MSIRIRTDQCIGCLKCLRVCPGSLIKNKEGKAFMKYPRDCWGCASCVKECRAGAIDFYLGADIGGNGSTMQVLADGDILHWQIQKQDNKVITIDVNQKDSNKY